MVVDLPAPLGPRKPVTTPRSDGEAEVVDGGDIAVALGGLVDFEHEVLPVNHGVWRYPAPIACPHSCDVRCETASCR